MLAMSVADLEQLRAARDGAVIRLVLDLGLRSGS
jgi:hypothetical protein